MSDEDAFEVLLISPQRKGKGLLFPKVSTDLYGFCYSMIVYSLNSTDSFVCFAYKSRSCYIREVGKRMKQLKLQQGVRRLRKLVFAAILRLVFKTVIPFCFL